VVWEDGGSNPASYPIMPWLTHAKKLVGSGTTVIPQGENGTPLADLKLIVALPGVKGLLGHRLDVRPEMPIRSKRPKVCAEAAIFS
jgi:hypothetical protein